VTSPDIEKLDGGGAHQGALDPAQFWRAMPIQVRSEAHTILDTVIEKLVALSVEEKLAAMVRAAPGRRS
jgi:hypothetical protein